MTYISQTKDKNITKFAKVIIKTCSCVIMENKLTENYLKMTHIIFDRKNNKILSKNNIKALISESFFKSFFL